MNNDMAKKITLESLARMIEQSFEEAAAEVHETREDVRSFREDVDHRFDGVERKIDALGNEVREIKVALPPLVRSVERLEVEVLDLHGRVNRLEKKKARLAK